MSKYATGEWQHLFGVGRQETRCRILVDLKQSKLIAAQEWTGLKFVDIYGDRLKDLAESVIEVNEAHVNLDDWIAQVSDEAPEWAGRLMQSGQERKAEPIPSKQISDRLEQALPEGGGYEKGYKDALQSVALALAPKIAESILDEAITTALDAYANNADQEQSRVPRVLVVVSGGVAEDVSDAGVEVEVFDWDNYKADPEGTGGVPAHFADLAEQCDIPVGPAEARNRNAMR